LLFLALPVYAADEPPATSGGAEDVDEIVVVANKIERSIRDVAANVTVLERTDIESTLATSVDYLLRYTPGIEHEAAGARFGTEGISIRGIGGNRVAILVDGVPLSDQFDVGSFSNATRDFLSTGLIERVEVLHGPASALYGSSAIGGVVLSVTPDPADVARGGGGRLQGTWHDVDSSTHGSGLLALEAGGAGVLLGASHHSGQETPSAAVDTVLDFRDFTRESALAKLVVDDRRGLTWRLGFIYQGAATQSDLNSFLGSGRWRSTTALVGDDNYRMRLGTASVEFGSADTLSGIARAWVQVAETRQSTLDERGNAARPVAIDRDFSFDQRLRGLEVNLHRAFSSGAFDHRLGAGIEYRERLSEELRDGLETGLEDGMTTKVLLGEEFPLRDFPRSETREWGAFVEDTVEAGDWSIIAAVRADRYSLGPLADPVFAEDYPFANPVAIDESDVSPKLALIRRFGDAAEVYLQYARGFRAPPFEEANIGLEIPLFNIRPVPNPDLRSETSDGYEAGLRWRGADLSLHAALFRTDYEDFIASRVPLGPDPSSGRLLFQAQNIEDATIEGFEAGWEYRLPAGPEDLFLEGSLYDPTGENGDTGEPLNSVGPAQAIVGLRWQPVGGRSSLRLLAKAIEAWDDRDETAGPLFKPPGTLVTDLYYSREIGDQTTLRFAVRNLADRTWWHWSSVRGLAPDDPLVPHLAQPGRNASVGIEFDW